MHAMLARMSDDFGAFLARPSIEVAPELLGWTFSTVVDGEIASVRLTEVEAYMGADDPASHAYNGITPRTEPMFMAPPRIYVYLSYGVHFCVNIVTRPEGVAGAVLLRGGDPIDGLETMRARRGRATNLTDGPGKLGQALGVTTNHSGLPIDGELVTLSPGPPPAHVVTGPRIGISKAKDRQWRFVAID
jgi:DNA-3-methyladenine glycosylase